MIAMPSTASGRRMGRPSKGPRVVIFPQLPLADERALKDLADRRGVTWSEIGAELIAVGLRRRSALPTALPLRYSAGEATELTVRIPVADNEQLRTVVNELGHKLAIVSGALIQLGLQHTTDLAGQLPVQYSTHSEARLTRAS